MSTSRQCVCGWRGVQLALVAGAAFAVPGGTVLGQDSVSTSPGLPGDAVSAYLVGAGGEQVNNYVVDLPLRVSSWGTKYRLGVLAKASLSTNTSYYNHLIASTVASPVLSPIGTPVRSAYSAWTTTGLGVNATRNGVPGTVTVSAVPMQTLGTAFLEFAGGPDGVFGNSDDENNVIATMVSLAPQYPARVYVSRIVAATNRSSTGQANAMLGLGMIDAQGNLSLLGDGTGLLGPNPITNKKTFRVDSLLRSTGVVNVLNESGGSDSAATRIVGSSTTSQSTPTLIPKGLAGRPIVLGADLANSMQSEVTANILSGTTAHLGAGVSGRGTVSFSPFVFGPLGSGPRIGTGVMLSRGSSTSKTRGISAWSLTAGGVPTGTVRVELPTAVGGLVDLDDGFDLSAAFGSPENQEFTNYQSQTVFRGPCGPAAAAVIPGGDLLLAGTVAATGGGATTPAGMNNAIAVARVSAATQQVSWTIAAHTGNAAGAAGGLAKAIYGDFGADGEPGTGDAGEGDGTVDAVPIGWLCLASEAVTGASTGPSLSSPAIDAAGNVWFMSSVRMREPGGTTRGSIALLRANLDRATNRYRLELVTELGVVAAGLNSGRNYQMQFVSVADADSVDSGTLFSSSLSPLPLAGVNASTLPYGSGLSFGAMVFRAKVVYDANNNGQFADPTLPGGTGNDEAYNVSMLLLPARSVADVGQQGGQAPGDGRYDNNDFIVYIDAFFNGNNAVADVGSQGGVALPDGELDNNDFIVFIDAFFNQQ